MDVKRYLGIVIVLLASFAARPQTSAVKPNDAEQIQIVVGALVSERLKADVLLRDLTDISGYVTALEEDAFYLSTEKKGRDKGFKLLYTDVLAISSKKGSISLVPDPTTATFGAWADLKKLAPNTLIEITDNSGVVRAGRFRSSSKDTIVIADNVTNAEQTLQFADVAYMHRVRYGWSDVSGGLASGAGKGAKIGKEVGKATGGIKGPISGQPMGDGTGAAGSAMGAGVGAIIGVIGGASSKTNSLKILIYSK